MKRNENGFALIQVIIAASVLSVLSLAMTSLITEQQKSTRYLEDQLEKIQIIRNLETILKDGIACQETLSGAIVPRNTSSYQNVDSLKDNSGAVVYQSNTDYGPLRVGQVRIQNQTVPGPNSTGFVDIEVPFRRLRSGGGPQDLRSFIAKISVTVDAARTITSCSSSTGKLEDGGLHEVFGGNGVRVSNYDIPGQHDICVMNGFRTTADDSNNYDGCRVVSISPQVWRIVLNKHSQDSLRCFARCFSVN